MEQEIADRKRAESERAEMLARAQAAQAEAEEANRLKDEFLATVSHELRAPLERHARLGHARSREGRLDEESKERALETVERNARTQKKLVDDLLDVSSIITGNLSLDLEPTDLASRYRVSGRIGTPGGGGQGGDVLRTEACLDPGSERMIPA